MRLEDETPEDDNDFSLEDAKNFHTLKGWKCVLGSHFQYGKKTYKNYVQKFGIPDSHWAKCLDHDTAMVANLPKKIVRDTKAK